MCIIPKCHGGAKVQVYTSGIVGIFGQIKFYVSEGFVDYVLWKRSFLKSVGDVMFSSICCDFVSPGETLVSLCVVPFYEGHINLSVLLTFTSIGIVYLQLHQVTPNSLRVSNNSTIYSNFVSFHLKKIYNRPFCYCWINVFHIFQLWSLVKTQM